MFIRMKLPDGRVVALNKNQIVAVVELGDTFCVHMTAVETICDDTNAMVFEFPLNGWADFMRQLEAV